MDDTTKAIIELILDTRAAKKDMDAFVKSITADVNSALKAAGEKRTNKNVIEANLREVEKGNEKQLGLDARWAKATQALHAKLQADIINGAIKTYKEKEQLNEKQLSIDAAQAKIRSGIEARRASEAIAIQQRYYHEQAKEEAKRMRGARQIDLSRAGRVGAGLATMSGNYQMAGGLYAASNMLDAMSIKIPVVGAAVLGVTAALAVGGVAFLAYGEALNKDLAAMSTLLLPATSGTEALHMAMEKATNSAVKLSNTFNVDLNDVIKGYKDALSSGIDANDLDRFGRASAILSTALGESFGSTTQILTTFKDTYKLTMGEMEGIGDKLFNVVDVGRVNSKQMLDNLGRLIPVAKTAGITVTDMLGAFSTLTRTMTVSQATTSLGRAIEGIISPSKDSILAFNELGIAYGSAAFVGRSLAEVIKDIRDKTGAEGEILNRLFPNVQMQRGIAQLSTQLELLDRNTKAIDVTNTAIIAANRAQDTLGNNVAKVWTGIVNSIEIAARMTGTWVNEIGKKVGIFKDPDKEAAALNGGFKAYRDAGENPANLSTEVREQLGIRKRTDRSAFTTSMALNRDEKGNILPMFAGQSSDWMHDKMGPMGEHSEGYNEWKIRDAQKIMEENDAKYGGTLNTGISAQRELMSDEAKQASARIISDRQTEIQARLTDAQEDEYKRLIKLKDTSLATDAAQGNAFADRTFAEHFKKVDLYKDGEPGGVGNKFDLEKEFKELNDAVVAYRAGLGTNTKLLQEQLKAFEDGILTQRESKDIKEEITATARVEAAEDRIDRQGRREAISIKIKALREEAAAASKEARANDSKIKEQEEKIKDPRKLKAGERLNGDRGVVALLEANKAAYDAAVVKVNEIKDAIAALMHDSKAIGNETAQDIIDNKGARVGSGSAVGSGSEGGGTTSAIGSGAGTYRDGTNFHSGGASGAGYVKEGPRGTNQKNRGKLSPENQKFQDERDARYDAELGIMRKKAIAETELVGNALTIVGDKVTIHTTSMVNDVVKGWGMATVAFLNYSAAVQSGLASMKTIGDTSNNFHIDIQNSGGGKTDTDALAREVKIKVDKAEANNILKSDYGSKNKPPLATTGGKR